MALTDIFNNMRHRFSLLMTGGNIEKDQLVSALLVITLRHLNRITCITNTYKLNTFNNATRVDVQARNNAFG